MKEKMQIGKQVEKAQSGDIVHHGGTAVNPSANNLALAFSSLSLSSSRTQITQAPTIATAEPIPTLEESTSDISNIFPPIFSADQQEGAIGSKNGDLQKAHSLESSKFLLEKRSSIAQISESNTLSFDKTFCERGN